MKQNRIRKVQLTPEPVILATAVPEIIEESEPTYPQDWTKGALLNVRNAGETYNVTLYPEEYDPRHPERTLKFSNSAKAQDFVSRWYMRETHNPLAW